MLVRADYGSTVTGRVRHLIGTALPAGPVPTPEQLADRLSVSPQTLRRRLAAEGTTYQRLRDQVRRDHALAELSAGRVSIERLSRQLGFSEPSAFHRAFRRWTGQTPRAYRARDPLERDDRLAADQRLADGKRPTEEKHPTADQRLADGGCAVRGQQA